MYKTIIGLAALAAATGATAAVPINFNTAANPVGNSHTYTSGSLSVTATGYASTGTQTGLYTKTCSGVCDENGLGLAGYTDSEINKGTDFIQLDVHNLFGLASGASFFMGSTTNGERWQVYGSNTAGALGTALFGTPGSDENLHALSGWGTYNYYDFVALGTWNGEGYSAGNVLLGGLSVTPGVPEPSTWAMMLLGFGAMGFAMRRQRKTIPQVA